MFFVIVVKTAFHKPTENLKETFAQKPYFSIEFWTLDDKYWEGLSKVHATFRVDLFEE